MLVTVPPPAEPPLPPVLTLPAVPTLPPAPPLPRPPAPPVDAPPAPPAPPDPCMIGLGQLATFLAGGLMAVITSATPSPVQSSESYSPLQSVSSARQVLPLKLTAG